MKLSPLAPRPKSFRDLTLFQTPNAPLAIAIVSAFVALILQGQVHQFLSYISIIALSIWGYDELTTGINWVRRLFGTSVLIMVCGALWLMSAP